MLSMHTSVFLSSTCKELKPRSLCSLFDVFKCRMLNSWLQGCIDPIPPTYACDLCACVFDVCLRISVAKGPAVSSLLYVGHSATSRQCYWQHMDGHSWHMEWISWIPSWRERVHQVKMHCSMGMLGNQSREPFFFLSWAQKWIHQTYSQRTELFNDCPNCLAQTVLCQIKKCYWSRISTNK